MDLFRVIAKVISNNLYLIVGLVIGMYISSLFSIPHCLIDHSNESRNLTNVLGVSQIINANTSTRKIEKPSVPSKKAKPVRPRYYSTELGIREKLFVGVLTSEERINSRAVHLNATLSHLVDKLKFFITVQNKVKTSFNLTGVVGFTDTRHKYKPFQVIKYIGDSFLLDFDYYFIINDYSYINIRALKDIANKISVSSNVYLGRLVPESSFCNLDAGILISNSVLKAMRENLEWCVANAVSDDHSENIGRCVYHSTNLECQEEVQNQKLTSFKFKHSTIDKYLETLSKNKKFRNAVTVYPVLQSRDFYLLNAFFSRQRLMQLKQQNDELSKGLTESWPPGHRSGNKPETRFDLPRRTYFNTTHMFFNDDFSSIEQHTKADIMDIQNIISQVVAYETHKFPNRFQYRRLVNGYRTFDLSRGMDYVVDLGFRDLTTGKEVIKRFEVCKPLGKVEFTPVPYVTENTRVTIILPVQESEKNDAKEFLRNYVKSVVNAKDRSFLMLVLLYQYNSPSKNSEDIFSDLKNIALKMINKNPNEESKVAWVSVRLPLSIKSVSVEDYSVLNYAVIDLALKKIGLDSLNLVLDVHADITIEFLNRVRMNTIEGFQVFSPIPFRQYNPQVSGTKRFEVNKNVGHFDREEFRYLAFYSKDYIEARKRMQYEIPIVKVDNDLSKILQDEYKNQGNVLDMFVKYGVGIHCMRATESQLKVRYHEELNENRSNWFVGNVNQLAHLVLNAKDEIGYIWS